MQADELHPRHRCQGCEAGQANAAPPVNGGKAGQPGPVLSGPGEPDPHWSNRQQLRPGGSKVRLRGQIRRAGNRRHGGFEYPRQTDERAMEIERRRSAVAGEDRLDPRDGLHHAHQRSGNPGQHARAALGQQRRITQELHGVAKPLLMRQQHNAAGQVAGFLQRRQQQVQRQRDRTLDLQAPLEVGPRIPPPARVQQCHRPVDPDLRVRRRRGHRPRIGCDRAVELPLDLQQQTQIGPARGLSRIGPHRLVEMPDRFLVMAQLRQGQAHGVLRDGRARMQLQPFAQQGDGRFRVAALLQETGEGLA